MSDVQDCLAKFSSAALVGAPDAREQAWRAVNELVAAHAAAPLGAISALYELLDAFRDLKIVSRASAIVDDDILERILRLEHAMLTRAAASRSEPEKFSYGNRGLSPC